LVDQVEFANVVVINKTDLVTPYDLEQLTQLIAKLNERARIVHSTEGKVPLNEVLGTGLFSLSEAESRPEWLAVPRGQETSETEEYGISSFVFRSRRPFHPQRLSDALDTSFDDGIFSGVLRSKGLAWIASKNDWAYDWSQAGCSIRLNPAGYWWAAAPEDEWPEDEDGTDRIKSQFLGIYGDRRQELVFIGNSMDEARICQILESCLLPDLEFVQGPDFWERLSDPFPSVELQGNEEEVDA
jgi:G3E family GTPase